MQKSVQRQQRRKKGDDALLVSELTPQLPHALDSESADELVPIPGTFTEEDVFWSTINYIFPSPVSKLESATILQTDFVLFTIFF